VTQESDFADALASAKREALSAFASDRMILEKALDNVRHIEVQVFGDAHGNIIHLGERDCSVQRRNQKIIEEAPAPGVSEDLRQRMGAAAVSLAKAVNYTNAGTVEYLLDRDGHFYFLEMNTRIQVEHPVTEEVTGTNLIQWQFAVAKGERLPLKQSEVKITGHAIEARLCAEDPADDFRPQTGKLRFFYLTNVSEPHRCRVDAGVALNASIGGDYDSMIAKMIAKGPTRAEARARLILGLSHLSVTGVRTNRAYVHNLLKNEEIAADSVDIGWLDRQPRPSDSNVAGLLGQIAALILAHGEGNDWRSTGTHRRTIRLRERNVEHTHVVENGQTSNTTLVELELRSHGTTFAKVVANGERRKATMEEKGGASLRVELVDGNEALFEDITYAPAEPKGGGGANVIRAPMAGRIIKVTAEPGQTVAKNQVLVILEAMKMEHELKALTDGVVESVSAKAGDQVAIRQTLVTLKT
jgi:geranyl-CoA carboxylase alpha subunit